MDAVIRQFRHLFRGFAENPIQMFHGDRVLLVGNLLFLGRLGIEFTGIKRRGIVGDAPRGAEGAGAGLFFGRIDFHSIKVVTPLS